jgi:DNA-binding transcriptional MocR family regulator
MIGFVLLQREIMDWEWYQSPTVSRIYIHLILKVNFIEKKWQGIIIERGQLVTSINSLSSELKLSNQQIRTALEKLVEGNYIIKRTTNNYTLITLVNYDKHQSHNDVLNKRKNNPKTIQTQSNSNPTTTTKQRNNGNNINKERVDSSMETFQKEVFENSQYSNIILKSFYNYWTELNKNTNKMRFENEKFFEIEKRLEKWNQNEKNRDSNSTQKKPIKRSNNR